MTVLVIWSLWLARRHIASVYRMAVSGERGDGPRPGAGHTEIRQVGRRELIGPGEQQAGLRVRFDASADEF